MITLDTVFPTQADIDLTCVKPYDALQAKRWTPPTEGKVHQTRMGYILGAIYKDLDADALFMASHETADGVVTILAVYDDLTVNDMLVRETLLPFKPDHHVLLHLPVRGVQQSY